MRYLKERKDMQDIKDIKIDLLKSGEVRILSPQVNAAERYDCTIKYSPWWCPWLEEEESYNAADILPLLSPDNKWPARSLTLKQLDPNDTDKVIASSTVDIRFLHNENPGTYDVPQVQKSSGRWKVRCLYGTIIVGLVLAIGAFVQWWPGLPQQAPAESEFGTAAGVESKPTETVDSVNSTPPTNTVVTPTIPAPMYFVNFWQPGARTPTIQKSPQTNSETTISARMAVPPETTSSVRLEQYTSMLSPDVDHLKVNDTLKPGEHRVYHLPPETDSDKWNVTPWSSHVSQTSCFFDTSTNQIPTWVPDPNGVSAHAIWMSNNGKSPIQIEFRLKRR